MITFFIVSSEKSRQSLRKIDSSSDYYYYGYYNDYYYGSYDDYYYGSYDDYYYEYNEIDGKFFTTL